MTARRGLDDPADVVQQGCDDERGGGAFEFGPVGGLELMLGEGNVLAEIPDGPLHPEEPEYASDGRRAHAPSSPGASTAATFWARRRLNTARRLARPSRSA